MAVSRRFGLVFAAEPQPGVAVASATLFGSGSTILFTSLSASYDKEEFSREVLRSSLSGTSPIKGVVECTINASFELAGTTGSTLPSYTTLLQACGLRQYVIKKGTISTIIAGAPGIAAFWQGEALTGTTGAGTAMLDTYNGETTMYVAETTALTGTITGGTSGSTVTAPGSWTACGWAWLPYSDQTSEVDVGALSGTISANEILQGGTSNAVIETVEAWTASTANQGFRYLDGTAIYAGETFTSITDGTSTAATDASTETQRYIPSLSVGFMEDGNRRHLIGARGKLTISAGNVGEPVIVNLELKGKLAADPNITGSTVNGTPETQPPPPFIGATSRVGQPADEYADEYVARLTAFTLDYGTTVAIQRAATETDGLYGAADMTGRPVGYSLTVALTPEDSFPFLDDLIAGNDFRHRMTIGTTVGNKFEISVPSIVLNSESGADQNGSAYRQLSGTATSSYPDGTEGTEREFALLYLTA